jgi:hypothetical protein
MQIFNEPKSFYVFATLRLTITTAKLQIKYFVIFINTVAYEITELGADPVHTLHTFCNASNI